MPCVMAHRELIFWFILLCVHTHLQDVSPQGLEKVSFSGGRLCYLSHMPRDRSFMILLSSILDNISGIQRFR
ncbi:hypothetical protein BYT27DRAFT_6786653 [Phlegmacium glaucopus]|nr:hypothetical protein BYT27DRAFT_6786653 [Phlegmacium glaucopus]